MSQTARAYAHALFELSKEQNVLKDTQNALSEIKNIISGVDDFRYFLSNPLLSYEERCVVLKGLFEGKVSELTFRFLVFITYKNRLSILDDIIKHFDSLYLISTNQLRAYVTTALPVDNKEKESINQRLHDKFQHQILTKWNIDPSLIGGFRIFVQGKIYDYSFKSQLNHFLQYTR